MNRGMKSLNRYAPLGPIYNRIGGEGERPRRKPLSASQHSLLKRGGAPPLRSEVLLLGALSESVFSEGALSPPQKHCIKKGAPSDP
ncbi:hypothetical protein SAMN05216537_10363 [Lachnospira multipara]|uniref:Uncharacterized protein n=1 Tax=Lachnospira multipara TaxID=28051 RepID=A0A1H5SPR0_9FIRM|nr:hypothetical protein SAMN05216537_10363 [Lachnospira multipara]